MVTEHQRVIDDVKDSRLRKAVELLKGRNKRTRVMIVDDEENIFAALHCGVDLFTLFVSENVELSPELLEALPSDIEIEVISVRVSKELFGVERRSRIFALARKPLPWSLTELLELKGDIVVLDGVRLMGNIGAIARSTRALGFAGIVLVDSALADVMDRRLIRASRGMVFSLPVVIASADEVVEQLREHEVSIVSLEPRVPTPLPEIAQVEGRIAILLGSEKHGPSATLSEAAAHQMTIAIHPEVQSLNVSVSAALAMYQRRESNPLPRK